jgi:hypothetical protein
MTIRNYHASNFNRPLPLTVLTVRVGVFPVPTNAYGKLDIKLQTFFAVVDGAE